jgi:UDP-N-acetylglucosamine 2-epimerase (hydrolysing)
MKKKIIFLTGTRADFGKMRSIILELQNSKKFDVEVFVTGMHLLRSYGLSVNEIKKVGIKKIYTFLNQKDKSYNRKMDITLSKTVNGFSEFINRKKPDLIVVHGDRLEALAGAIVGAFNNILTAHIEGGELSGTVDNSIRHAVSKLSQLHFVSNSLYKKRLIQLGEVKKSIFVIGSPDIDIMISKKLPSISKVKRQYNINFREYSILIFHPVTTELEETLRQTKILLNAIKTSKKNFVVIYPNNDPGSKIIINQYKKLKKNKRLKFFKTMRLTYFLTLLKNTSYIIGNSSAGIREAPFYGVPTINIGTRQNNRFRYRSVINIRFNKNLILKTMKSLKNKKKLKKINHFGKGKSSLEFNKIISKSGFWKTKIQKSFVDRSYFDITN